MQIKNSVDNQKRLNSKQSRKKKNMHGSPDKSKSNSRLAKIISTEKKVRKFINSVSATKIPASKMFNNDDISGINQIAMIRKRDLHV